MGKWLSPDSKAYQILSTAAGFVALNLLWLLCSAPLLTAGVSTAAMYTVTRKMARNEYPTILPDFFKAFRDNFKQATAIWLIAVVVGGILFSDYAVMSGAWGDISAIREQKIFNDEDSCMARPSPRLKDAAITLFNFVNDIEDEEAPAA